MVFYQHRPGWNSMPDYSDLANQRVRVVHNGGDPLRAPRGIAVGALLGLALWIAIANLDSIVAQLL
jgi:hypothetical protein